MKVFFAVLIGLVIIIPLIIICVLCANKWNPFRKMSKDNFKDCYDMNKVLEQQKKDIDNE